MASRKRRLAELARAGMKAIRFKSGNHMPNVASYGKPVGSQNQDRQTEGPQRFGGAEQRTADLSDQSGTTSIVVNGVKPPSGTRARHDAVHHAGSVILASAHATSALPYSPDFYVAIATVIPVLFLALALQGDTYRNLLTVHESAKRRGLAAAAKLTLRGLLMLPVMLILASYAQTAAVVILFAGLCGETAALWSLCYGRSVVAPGLVLAAAITLGAGIGLTLLWALAKAMIAPYVPLFHAYVNLLGKSLRGKQVTPADIVGLLKCLDADAEAAVAQPTAAVASEPEKGQASPTRCLEDEKQRSQGQAVVAVENQAGPPVETPEADEQAAS